MKIAFLSFYSGQVERGVETIVHELSCRLAKKHDVTVYQSGVNPTRDYKVKRINTWTKKPNRESEIKRRLFLDSDSQAIKEFTKEALKDLKKEKVDIVIPWNNGWQLLLCKLANVGKVVAVGESGLGWDDRVAIWSFPDCFVGLTKYQSSWAKRNNPFVKVVTIPNGVNLQKFKPHGTTKKINLPKPIILCVSALTQEKRIELAIKAVAKLKKGSLLVIGKGRLQEDLQKMGDNLLPVRFRIMSAPYEQMPQYYRGADVFTFPTSAWESFGIVMLEAMATNLPVVAGNDQIRKEIIGEGGLVVEVEDEDVYSQALQKTLNIKWGNKPRQRAEKYSWDKIAGQYEKLFMELTT